MGHQGRRQVGWQALQHSKEQPLSQHRQDNTAIAGKGHFRMQQVTSAGMLEVGLPKSLPTPAELPCDLASGDFKLPDSRDLDLWRSRVVPRTCQL